MCSNRLALRAQLEEYWSDEAVIPPAQQAPHQQAWIPGPDGHEMGPGHAFAPPQEGAQAVDRSHSLQARSELTARSERLTRANRLGRVSDIRHCQVTGQRRRSRYLEIMWADNSTGHPRMGLIVPKFQSSAVARNRLRRRLREVWRREIAPMQPSWDLLVRAKREAYAAPYAALRAELVAWRDATVPPASRHGGDTR